jgi:hypothetical protein
VFKEQRHVDAKYVDVCGILPKKENGQIKVSVVLVWKVPAFVNPTETSSLEMVLIDGKVSYVYNDLFVIPLCSVSYEDEGLFYEYIRLHVMLF